MGLMGLFKQFIIITVHQQYCLTFQPLAAMEVLNRFQEQPAACYSHGLRKTFIIDGLRTPVQTATPSETADIQYKVDEVKLSRSHGVSETRSGA